MRTLLFTALLVISGCTKEVLVYVDVYKPLDERHFELCPSLPPPDRVLYKASSDRERIKLWTNAYIEQQAATNIRNVKLKNSLEVNRALVK